MLPHSQPISYHESNLNFYAHHNEQCEDYLDVEQNYETIEIKLENREYIKEYDDSVIIQLSEDEDCFLLGAKRDRNIESEDQQNYHVKIQDHSFAYCKSDFKFDGSLVALKQKKKQRKSENVQKKCGSLKNISSAAYDMLSSLQKVKLSKLNEQLVDENPQFNKTNLKRRLYDVVSVLQSASIVQKKGQVLIKNVDGYERISQIRCKQEKRINMKKQIDEIGRRLQEKRNKLNLLQKQKMNLTKQVSKIPISNEKVMFPILCFISQKSTMIDADCIQAMEKQKIENAYRFENKKDFEIFLNKLKNEGCLKLEQITPDYEQKEICLSSQSTQ